MDTYEEMKNDPERKAFLQEFQEELDRQEGIAKKKQEKKNERIAARKLKKAEQNELDEESSGEDEGQDEGQEEEQIQQNEGNAKSESSGDEI
jgi:hypothetical protein